jgi:hypothetical protein
MNPSIYGINRTSLITGGEKKLFTHQFSAEFWEPCGPSWLWIGAVFDSDGLELKKTSCANLFSSGTQKILAACISCQVLY